TVGPAVASSTAFDYAHSAGRRLRNLSYASGGVYLVICREFPDRCHSGVVNALGGGAPTTDQAAGGRPGDRHQSVRVATFCERVARWQALRISRNATRPSQRR